MSYHYRHLNLHTHASETGQLAEAKVETNGYLLDLRETANAEIMVVRGSVPISSMPLMTHEFYKNIKIGIWKDSGAGSVTHLEPLGPSANSAIFTPDEFCGVLNRALLALCVGNGMLSTDCPQFSVNNSTAKFVLSHGTTTAFKDTWVICGDVRLYEMLLAGWRHRPFGNGLYRLAVNDIGEQTYSTAANVNQFTELVIGTDAMVEGEINASTSSAFAMRVLTDYSLAGTNPKVPINIVPSVDRWISFVPKAQPVTNMKVQLFMRDHDGEIHRLTMLEGQSLTLKLCVRYVTKE